MIATVVVAIVAFRIVHKTSSFSHLQVANRAFAIFESCKEVSEVQLYEESDQSLLSVYAALILGDGTSLRVRGAARQKQRAYHVASASALYALNKHRRQPPDSSCEFANQSVMFDKE